MNRMMLTTVNIYKLTGVLDSQTFLSILVFAFITRTFLCEIYILRDFEIVLIVLEILCMGLIMDIKN